MLKITEDVIQRHVYKCVFIYLSIYLFKIDHFSDNSWLGNGFKTLNHQMNSIKTSMSTSLPASELLNSFLSFQCHPNVTCFLDKSDGLNIQISLLLKCFR